LRIVRRQLEKKFAIELDAIGEEEEEEGEDEDEMNTLDLVLYEVIPKRGANTSEVDDSEDEEEMGDVANDENNKHSISISYDHPENGDSIQSSPGMHSIH